MHAIFTLMLLVADDMPEAGEPFGRVVSIAGKVTAFTGNITRPLARGDRLYKGDLLKSEAQSQAQILFADRTVMSLGPEAELVLAKIEPTPERKEPKVAVKLVVGKVWARVQKFFGGGSAFTVETTTAVAGVRGTSMIVQAHEHDTVVAIERGTGSVTDKNGKESTLPPMTMVSVNEAGASEVGMLDAAALGDLLLGMQSGGSFSVEGQHERLANLELSLGPPKTEVPPVNEQVATTPQANDASPVNLDPQQSNRDAVVHGTIQVVP
jgi:hypothetical protein